MQDEDVMDKFGEYGTVKAGNFPFTPSNFSLLFLKCTYQRVFLSEYADGSQNWLYQRIRFCRI